MGSIVKLLDVNIFESVRSRNQWKF